MDYTRVGMKNEGVYVREGRTVRREEDRVEMHHLVHVAGRAVNLSLMNVCRSGGRRSVYRP